MSEATQRRLAAVVAADVVGFSRLMGVDEVGTLAALRAHRVELIDPLIARHGGRIVKTTGDGLLLEFPSVVAAVECAIAVQEGLAERNSAVPDEKAIRLRVGVHIGDIIIEGDDIFGDGVNIAARVEALAEPDGVSLSDDAYRLVRDRLGIDWIDAGEHVAKNIARPLRLWRWRNSAPPPASPAQGAPGAAASAAAASPSAETPLPLPDRPSIAVLPFDNMSGDPEQEFFADGMTEDLITDLSKISGIFVVARNSSFVFKGQAVDIREVARKLGVRHVLEGSVRKVGRLVRINVQLIDAVSGGHLWAERYDGTVDNVFELQDEVGAKVVAALAVRLKGDEKQRLSQVHTHNLEAYELYVRARSTPYPPLPDRIAAAREMFERVIELDPEFAGGYAGVASILAYGAMFAHADVTDIAARAAALAREAVERDDGFGWAFIALALAKLVQGQHGEAIEAVENAVARQPNDADAYAYQGLILALAGRAAEGVEPIERALRLNPQFINGPYLNLRCIVKLLAGDPDGATRSFEENIARQGPVGPPVLCWAIAAYWASGREGDARRLVGQLEGQFPGFRLAGWNLLKLVRVPEERRKLHDLMVAAGVPD